MPQKTIPAIVLLLLAAVAAWWFLQNPLKTSTVQPLAEKPEGVFYLNPTERRTPQAQAFIHGQSPTQRQVGWVKLPKVPPPRDANSDPTSAGYLGTDACAECHQDYVNDFQKTAHFHTSQEAQGDAVRTLLEMNRDTLVTAGGKISFQMTPDNGKFSQHLVVKAKENTFSQHFTMDLITGSGKLGQSYLYWNDDHLYQAHVSLFHDENGNRWMNSPGFPDGGADYSRPIEQRCLDCHATFFQWVNGTVNQYRPDNYVLGVSCEKCHGPGKQHVDFHHAHPEADESHHITNPGNLPTARLDDLCSLCHAPAKRLKKPPFSYRPGDNIDDFLEFEQDPRALQGGVHSTNQRLRLSQSACFQQSEAMTCITCHNPHQHERGNSALFSQRCMQCHESQACGKFTTLGKQIEQNCIDCHLPRREDEGTQMNVAQGAIFPLLRDHLIQVYPEISSQVEAQLLAN